MQSFQTALSAVFPLFTLLALGVLLRRIGLTDEQSLNKFNNVCYKVLLQASLYYNIVTADIRELFNARLLLFALLGQLAAFLLSILFALPAEREKKRRGALAHGIYHANIAIFGILLGTTLCGEGNLGSIALLIAVIVPTQNILSVVILELFRENSKLSFRSVFSGMMKNPYIYSALLGFATQLIGLRFPPTLLNVIRDVGRCATPIALIVMGGLFNFSAVRANRKSIAVGVFGRLIAVPAILLSIAVALGFRGTDLVGLMILFFSPCAVSSFNMACAMDSDADLTAQLVVFTSLCSLGTVFAWVFLFSRMGLLV